MEDSIAAMLEDYQSDFECYRELQRGLNFEIDRLQKKEEKESREVDEADLLSFPDVDDDVGNTLFKVKKYLARSNQKWRRLLGQLAELSKREEKLFKQSGSSSASTRSRTDSGNTPTPRVSSMAALTATMSPPVASSATGPLNAGADGGVAAAAAGESDEGMARVYREWRSKGSNYDAVLKSPFPRKSA